MRLLRLHTGNVRGLRDGTYSMAADAGAVVVTGPGGAGKSSLLRAIAAARRAIELHADPPSPREILAPGAMQGVLRAEWQHGGETFDVVFRLGCEGRPAVPAGLQALSGGTEGAGTTFELVPARRSLDTRNTAPVPMGSRTGDHRKRFTDAADKYERVWTALSTAITGAAATVLRAVEERGVVFRQQLPDGLERYKRAVALMCPDLRLTSVEPREHLRPLVWFEKTDRSRVEVAELSDSELHGFLLACIFASCGARGSMVLVDTPELHVHPNDHKRHFHAMRELVGDGQLIVASTSPEILACVTPREIIDLGGRGAGA